MLKVGIVGCGKIADAHADQLQRIPYCEIVGVCDREELMAKQLHDRFPVKGYFCDLNALLETARPQVVHITTPPQSHFELGLRCLEFGCHVYIEKPFTVDAKEAQELVMVAEKRKLKVTAGHDDQFTHAAKKMRELISAGYLGGPPVHMESYYCYDLGDPQYARELLGDQNHWVRQLPGNLLHNTISHGISRIAEFLESEHPKVIAHGFASPFLTRLEEHDIIDELRVIISEHGSRTAYFTFSSQMRPVLKHFRIFGHRNGLVINHDHQTVIKLNGSKYKSYLDKFIPPYNLAWQYAGNAAANVKRFVKAECHMKSGMKNLIEAFYHAILEDAPLPITYREIVLTARIMDSIFSQVSTDGHHMRQDGKTECG